MTNIFVPIVLVMLIMACNQTNSTQQQPENKAVPTETEVPMGSGEAKAIVVDTKKLALDTDPVCGMPIAEIADTNTHEGKLYGFCSVECKESFKKSPKQYLTATAH